MILQSWGRQARFWAQRIDGCKHDQQSRHDSRRGHDGHAALWCCVYAGETLHYLYLNDESCIKDDEFCIENDEC